MSKSATTTDRFAGIGHPEDWLRNPTPGDVLFEDFLKPLGMSQTALANAIGVPPRRINEIVLGKRAVTADTDLRLTRYWGLSAGFFLGLQIDHDLLEQRR
ncbi:MAG: HigA family addiction module antitoxin, partial [bacterium]